MRTAGKRHIVGFAPCGAQGFFRPAGRVCDDVRGRADEPSSSLRRWKCEGAGAGGDFVRFFCGRNWTGAFCITGFPIFFLFFLCRPCAGRFLFEASKRNEKMLFRRLTQKRRKTCCVFLVLLNADGKAVGWACGNGTLRSTARERSGDNQVRALHA